MNSDKQVTTQKDWALRHPPFPVLQVYFFALGFGLFNAAHRFGNWVALRVQYGGERVAKEHIEIVADKNDIILSNGDRLPSGVAAIDRTIMVAGFIVSTILIGSLVIRFLFPRNERDLSKLTLGWGAGPALLLCLFEFFYITFGPLVRSEVIAGVTVIGSIAIAWIMHWLWDR